MNQCKCNTINCLFFYLNVYREVHTRIFNEVDLVDFKHLSNYLLLIKPKTVSNTDYARHLGVILFFPGERDGSGGLIGIVL